MLAIILVAGILSSCRIFNPSVMLRTKKDYPYAVAQDTVPQDYILQKGDLINFRLFSNQGFKIIDLSTMEDANRAGQQLNNQNSFRYLIEADSSINLPIIGRVKIAGYNLKEAEMKLEDYYKDYYNDPYVILEVRNRRITVFPGKGGAAKVVTISDEYITIVEALALAGGISDGGKAHKVKVIRGNLNDPLVYKVDMSSVKGLADANMHFIKANDIIYVEPNYFVGRQVLTTTAQILALVTNSIATYLVVTNFVGNP